MGGEMQDEAELSKLKKRLEGRFFTDKYSKKPLLDISVPPEGAGDSRARDQYELIRKTKDLLFKLKIELDIDEEAHTGPQGMAWSSRKIVLNNGIDRKDSREVDVRYLEENVYDRGQASGKRVCTIEFPALSRDKNEIPVARLTVYSNIRPGTQVEALQKKILQFARDNNFEIVEKEY